ncbi:MAG TPA: biopolymer transporter ExbD [Planctomycetaceae bacterium]|nr:biopolymer transporter ExbD [Planctomycetaceae bacterium]
MKSPDTLKPPTPTLNLTPMIDVVFLLIIFFLVSSTLMRQEVSMEIDLPTAVTGKMKSEISSRKLTINLPREGTILLGTRPVSPDGLRNLLREEVRNPKNAAGLEIVIRTDQHVPYRRMEQILRDCAEAGIWKIDFAVYGE